MVFVLLAFVAGVSALLWLRLGAGSKSEGENRRIAPIPVIAEKVVRRDMPIWLDGIGSAQPLNKVVVSSRITGELMELGFREGSDVAKGDIIAKIDSRTLQAEYNQALAARDQSQTQLDVARLDLRRYTSLGDRISGQTLDSQRAKVKELEATVKHAEAVVDAARTQLSFARIEAPISGRAGLRRIDAGNIVQANDPEGIVVITQMEPINVSFTLSQQSLPALLSAMRMGEKPPVLIVDSASGETLEEGVLETMDNQIDPNTGSIRLKAIFANKERRLWPGGFVSVRLRAAVRNGLIVPLPAIQRGPDGAYVYVVGKDDKASMVPAKIAAVEDDMALLERGPDEGDMVVIDGMARLSQGAIVTLSERPGRRGAP